MLVSHVVAGSAQTKRGRIGVTVSFDIGGAKEVEGEARVNLQLLLVNSTQELPKFM